VPQERQDVVYAVYISADAQEKNFAKRLRQKKQKIIKMTCWVKIQVLSHRKVRENNIPSILK
jgi:hypothetical protein